MKCVIFFVHSAAEWSGGVLWNNRYGRRKGKKGQHRFRTVQTN